jgi:hypothetical protein
VVNRGSSGPGQWTGRSDPRPSISSDGAEGQEKVRTAPHRLQADLPQVRALPAEVQDRGAVLRPGVPLPIVATATTS